MHSNIDYGIVISVKQAWEEEDEAALGRPAQVRLLLRLRQGPEFWGALAFGQSEPSWLFPSGDASFLDEF